MRVLFFGTPDFATPPLRALLGEGFDVVGVVTQPDKPHGRSRSTLVPPPVKTIALAEGIPVLQPERPRGDAFLDEVRALAPDVSVVVAYGHILPRELIDLPPRGTLNIHASLLPRWRGAAPIQSSICAGDAETGISIMRLVPKLDAGPVLLQTRIPILDDETAGELQLRLSEVGAQSLIEALALLELGAAVETVQDESLVTVAPKVERADARADFPRPAADVARRLRAFDPRPGAWAEFRDTELKLFGPRVESRSGPSRDPMPGELLDVGPSGLLVACGEQAVRILDVQQAGKRRMGAAEWARGVGVNLGERLR